MSDCLFCKITAGEIPGDILYEDDDVLAFRDINPQAPFHALVIPRRHVASLDDVSDDDGALLGKLLLAGFIPGAFSAVVYAALIIGMAVVFKTVGPPVTGFTWRERFAALPPALRAARSSSLTLTSRGACSAKKARPGRPSVVRGP